MILLTVLFFLIFVASLILLIPGIIWPNLFRGIKILGTSPSRKKVGLFLIGIVFFSLTMMVETAPPNTNQPAAKNADTTINNDQIDKNITTPITPNIEVGKKDEASTPNFEIVESKEGETVQNIMAFTNPGNEGALIAAEVRKTCKMPCNISIFDDKKALNLQIQYDEMMGDYSTEPADLQNWKINNYVFVADHLIGYSEFSNDDYSEYPYKDWYYEELKGK